jgi:hypothetical protein
VNLDEALAELGIDRGATPDAAKRAYLRLLKTRKPEVDPDGFKRLREAYELVKGDLEFLAMIRGARMVAVEAEKEEEARSSQRRSLAVRVTEPAREVAPPFPEAQSASLPDPAPDPAPAPASTPEIPPLSTPEPVPSLQEIDALLKRGEFPAAAAALERVYVAATRSMVVSPPPVGIALDLLLTLHERNAVPVATSLQRVVQRWLDATGAEVKLLQGRAGAIWSVVRELSAAPPALSPTTRGVIVRLVRGARWPEELLTLLKHRDSSRLQAMNDARILEAHPHIPGATAIARALSLPPPRLEPAIGGAAPSRSSGRGWLVVIPICLALLRLCAYMSRDSSPSFTPSTWTPPPDLGALLGDSSVLRRGARTEDARRKATLVAGMAMVAGLDREHDSAMAVEDSLLLEDCTTALLATARLQGQLAAETSESAVDLRSDARELQRLVVKACPGDEDADVDLAFGVAGDARARDARAGGVADARARGADAMARGTRLDAGAAACGGAP